MSGTETVMRAYTANDKSETLNLIDLNTPKYFAFSEREDFENYLNNERELYFVIAFKHKIIGCGGINFESNKTIGVISWDIVHPNYQGKTFGKQLLLHRLKVLNAMEEIEKIIVRTSQITYEFYQKYGFQIKEIVPNYWADGFDLYAMEYTKP